MNSQKILTKNKYGEKLVGLLDLPDSQENKLPAVILLHGFGGEKTESGLFDDIAQELNRNNFLSYRFDFSGLGQSEGDYSKTTLTRLTEDLRSMIDFVKSQPEVDASMIAIIGFSLGTAVATALNAPEIKTYVFLGSVADPYNVLKSLFLPYTFNPEGTSFRITSEGKHIKMESQFWKNFVNYNLLDAISEIHKPILMIHGEKDTRAPISGAESFYNSANEPKKMSIIKNADHGFYEPDERRQAIAEAMNWLQKYLI